MLVDEEVDNVEETINAVVVVRSDGNKRDGDTTGDSNRVLNVQVLWMSQKLYIILKSQRTASIPASATD